jgi:hypothetical protein
LNDYYFGDEGAVVLADYIIQNKEFLIMELRGILIVIII